jgi:hypothetical protein
MTRLMIASLIACAVVLAPLGMQSRANDAHHPEKAAKGKKNVPVKTKKTNKPAAKANKTSARGVALDTRNA